MMRGMGDKEGEKCRTYCKGIFLDTGLLIDLNEARERNVVLEPGGVDIVVMETYPVSSNPRFSLPISFPKILTPHPDLHHLLLLHHQPPTIPAPHHSPKSKNRNQHTRISQPLTRIP